jgi:hypothetical protein
VPYLDNYWSVSFSPKSDPPVFDVRHLHKYFDNLSNFISHAISNFQERRSLTMATLVTCGLDYTMTCINQEQTGQECAVQKHVADGEMS